MCLMSFYMDSWVFSKVAIFHEQQVLWGFSEKENRENMVAEILSGKISNKQTCKEKSNQAGLVAHENLLFSVSKRKRKNIKMFVSREFNAYLSRKSTLWSKRTVFMLWELVFYRTRVDSTLKQFLCGGDWDKLKAFIVSLRDLTPYLPQV